MSEKNNENQINEKLLVENFGKKLETSNIDDKTKKDIASIVIGVLKKIDREIEEYPVLKEIKGNFIYKLEKINSLNDSKMISEHISSLLGDENLLRIGIDVVRQGDTASATFVGSNIKPEKAYIDGNIKLKAGDVEFLNKSAILVLNLKDLEKKGLIDFKGDVPVLNENTPIENQFQIIGLIDQYICEELKKDSKNIELLNAKNNLDNLKIEILKKIDTEINSNKVTQKDLSNFTNSLKNSVEITQNQPLKDFIYWFEGLDQVTQVLLLTAILTVGILGIMYLAPLILTAGTAINTASITAFVTFTNSPIFKQFLSGNKGAFVMGLAPKAQSIFGDKINEMGPKANTAFQSGRILKDIVSGLTPGINNMLVSLFSKSEKVK